MTLARAWAALAGARKSRMTATNLLGGDDPWIRSGTGMIEVTHPTSHQLEWAESGSWQEANERPTSFRNRLRWRWDVAHETIRLHHLRLGDDRPVHLVDLVMTAPDHLSSVAPHHCAADRYLATLTLGDAILELCWEVHGPAKSYTLLTAYEPG
jgi:hypothetical protein